MNQILPGGEPFFLPGGDVGTLLIHGFTGAPKEMRWLGENLASEGYSVLGIRLFGHATSQEDMIRARYKDWLACVEDGYSLLSGCCKQQIVIGLSLGGALALYAGAHYPFQGVVALSAPFEVPDSRISSLHPIVPLLSKFWRFSKKDAGDWYDPEPAKDHLDYPSNPIRSVAELHNLLQLMRKSLPKIRVPTLLIHSKGDHVIPQPHPKLLLQRIGAEDKDIVWLERSGHVVTRDIDREQVLLETTHFIQRITAA